MQEQVTRHPRHGRAVAGDRDKLVGRTRETLAKCGFYVSNPHNLRSISFDLVARRDRQLLILKALCNIDSLSSDDADEMKIMASMLGASPMVIGMHSSCAELEDGILYTRFGIPIVSEGTFSEFMLEGVPPLVYAAPGGLYVRLDGEMLKEIRQARVISLGALAEAIGVSRKAIQMYETGMGAMVDIANKIEEFLDVPLVLPLDPFVYASEVADHFKEMERFDGQNKDVFEMLKEIGYSVIPTKKAPFEAFAKEEELLLLTGIGDDPVMTERKARVVGNLSRVTERKSVIIVHKRSSTQEIEGTPLVTKDELRKVDHSDDFMELVLKREKRRTT